MKIFSTALDLAKDPELAHKKLQMAVGNFDGLHLGHRKLLQKALAQKRQLGGCLAVYSFSPHPQTLFIPEKKHIHLENRETWYHRFREFGVEVLIEEKFTREFSLQSADEFLQKQWLEALRLQSLVVGQDFRFGHGRLGDFTHLTHWARENRIELFGIPPFLVNKERVSTSGIKLALEKGELKKAHSFLGRPFSIRGTVQPGDRKGRELGFPTLNLSDSSSELLKRGVYLTSVRGALDVWDSITNVGIRPTVHKQSPVLVESHILGDFQDNLYGQAIEVEFLEFLRPEKKFASLDELKKQIQIDVQLSREYFLKRKQGGIES